MNFYFQFLHKMTYANDLTVFSVTIPPRITGGISVSGIALISSPAHKCAKDWPASRATIICYPEAGSFQFIICPRHFAFSKPPLCKGRWRGFPRRRDCFIFHFLQPTISRSSSMTAFGPGRKHSLLPALAKNMPTAYFLNAPRPLHKGAFSQHHSTLFFCLDFSHRQ